MSQNQPTLPIPSAERLQEIRDADAAIGDAVNLRWWPSVHTQRRELLALVDQLVTDRENDALAVAALSGMLEPYSGGTSDLHDLVARMHRAREIQQAAVRQPVAGPVASLACCSNERRNNNGGCDSCGAPCL